MKATEILRNLGQSLWLDNISGGALPAMDAYQLMREGKHKGRAVMTPNG